MPNVDIAAIRDVKSLKGSLPPEEWDARVDLAACYRLVRANGWNMNIFNHASMRVPGIPIIFSSKPMPCYGMRSPPLTL